MAWNFLRNLRSAARVFTERADGQSWQEQRAQDTLDSIGDGVISTDAAGNLTYINPVAEEMTGWSRHEASGRPLPEILRIVDADDHQCALNPLATAMLQNETVGLSANCVLIRRDGHESAVEDTATPIHDRCGNMTGAVIVFHDVGVAREMSLKMSYLAQHDYLTELPNRLLLNDRLTQAIAAAHRRRCSLAVLFLDVDAFKTINDSLGHAVGDQLLQSIAQRLVAAVRSSDTVSRHGGDEFVILLSEVSHAQDVAMTAKKIVASLAAPHHLGDQILDVTVSVGISVYPADGKDAPTLLKSADIALVYAKASGGSNYRFFAPDLTLRALQRAGH